MTLVICEECGKQIASYATACPQCGFPRNSVSAQAIEGPLPSGVRASTRGTGEQPDQVTAPDSTISSQESLKNKRTMLTDKLANAERNTPIKKYCWLLWGLLAALPGICLGTYVTWNYIRTMSDQGASRNSIRTSQVNPDPSDMAGKRNRLDSARDYLAKLRSAVPMTIQAQRQFDVDPDTKLPMWQAGVYGEIGLQVLIAQPDDLSFGALRQGRKVVKVDRRRVSMKHTSDTGLETTSDEYANVYLVVTQEEINEAEKRVNTLQREIAGQ